MDTLALILKAFAKLMVGSTSFTAESKPLTIFGPTNCKASLVVINPVIVTDCKPLALIESLIATASEPDKKVSLIETLLRLSLPSKPRAVRASNLTSVIALELLDNLVEVSKVAFTFLRF